MPEQRARTYHRNRVANTFSEEIGAMLEGELSDPRIAPSYVTDVVLAPGGKSARIFVAVHGNEEEEASTLEGLMAARAYIRSQLTSPARPDGDAIGATLALAEVLDQLGRQVDIILADPIPSTYRALPNLDRIHHTPSANDIDPDQNTPAILLECDGIARTGLLGLEGRTLINIDPHASGRPFASLNCIDEHASA